MNEQRAWENLKTLAHNRTSATELELEAAKWIASKVEEAGLKASIEPFAVPEPIIETVKLEADGIEYYCTAQGRSGSTSDEGIEGPLVYAAEGVEEELVKAKGAIILTTAGMNVDFRKRCIEAGALGYITTWGGLYDDEIMCKQVPHRNCTLTKTEDDNFPGVMVHLTTAEEILKQSPERIKIVLKQDKDHEGESRNVITTIEGCDEGLKKEVVVFSAHFDSVEFSPGAWDNGTGSITLLELMYHYLENKPLRTVKFVWCGSEETGLRGSWAYCEAHQDELKDIILNINFDMLGTYFGSIFAFGSCEQVVLDHAATLAKMNGLKISTRQGLMPSDSTSFALHNVPAMSFGQGSMRLKGAEIHNRRDGMDHLSSKVFIHAVEYIAKFGDSIINSQISIVPKTLPEAVKKEAPASLRRHGWSD